MRNVEDTFETRKRMQLTVKIWAAQYDPNKEEEIFMILISISKIIFVSVDVNFLLTRILDSN